MRGVIVPLITPYKGERAEEVDLEAMARLADYLAQTRASALFPVSGVGQAGDLSLDEKKRIIATVVAAARKRKPVLAGVGSGRGGRDIDEVIEVARYAQSVGADAIMAVTPKFGAQAEADEQELLVAYYSRLCREVHIPLVVYDSTAKFQPQTMVRLLDACPNIIGMKYRETEDMVKFAAMTQAARGRAAILSGSEMVAVKTMRAGAEGFIGGGVNLYPDLGADLVAAAVAGDWARAEELQTLIAELNEKMEKLGGGAQGTKKILNDVLGVAMSTANRGDTFRPESYPGEYQAILDRYRQLNLPRYASSEGVPPKTVATEPGPDSAMGQLKQAAESK